MTYLPDKKGREKMMVPMQKFLAWVICQVNPDDLILANDDLFSVKLHCTPENQLVHDFMKCGTIIIIIIIVKHFMKP